MSTQGDKLKAIANAIRAKEGSSDPIVANDFPARIAAIETGTQLPTLTNPGTAADMAQGKQLIDQNGEIVTGTLVETSNFVLSGSGYTPILKDGNIECVANYSNSNYPGHVARFPIQYGFRIPASDFGNATAADVVAGKTFTSEAGVKVSGTGQLSQFFTGTLRVRSATAIVEFVSPAGLIQRYNQVVNDVISVYVPGTVIFVNIMDSNNNPFRPKVIEGFDNTYWVDTTKDVSGYRISYGAFIAKPGYSVYNIEFDIF